jgi:cardiolipin synthase A/B
VKSLAWLALLLSACASVPPAEVKGGSNWIRVTGDCNCKGQGVAKSPDTVLREAVKHDAAAYEYARKVGAAETALTRQPAFAGNQVTLLIDGPAAHAAQLAAIRKARHHIHLDIYIITDEEIGQQYAEALIERAQNGVTVRLMFDSIGGAGAGSQFKKELKAAGVQLLEFHKTNDPRIWRINRRSHRKLLVVDGQIAFTGGINIMDEYAESSPAGEARSAGSGTASSGGLFSGSGGAGMRSSQLAAGAGWRDTHIQVQGPAVASFQRAFLDAWENGKGEIDLSGEYFPPQPSVGDDIVRVLTSEGTDLLSVFLAVPQSVAKKLLSKREKRNVIYGTYFNAIRLAEKRVWITQSYFAPNGDFTDLLRETAQRGVDVRLLLPAKSDVGYLPLITRHYYDRLLKAGVRIYEYEPVMLHAKTAVVDGVWSTVGSANLDYRSFIHNDEANAVVIGKSFGRQMEKLFEQDMQQSQAITLEQWRARPWVERLKETGASLFKYWI